MVDILKKTTKKACKHEKRLLAKQTTAISQPSSESTARTTTTAQLSAATLTFTPTPATNAALANWTIKELDAKLFTMEKQWAQTKSGPFLEAIHASMKDLRERLESKDEMRGEKGIVGDRTKNMEEVRTPLNDVNNDASHLVLNDGGTSTSPVPFLPAAHDTGDIYVTSIKCEGEDPQKFLHTFRVDMLQFAVTDNQKIANVFVDYLGTDSTDSFPSAGEMRISLM
jgi:hypothetical protein